MTVPTIRVLCARAMHQPMQPLAEEFAAATGQPVELTFGTVGAIKARLAAGETADIVIAATALIEMLEKAGTLVAGSATVLGRTRIGIAGRAGAAVPDVSTPEAFREALLAVRAIAVTDPAAGGSAGTFLPGLFERLGIAASIAGKLKRQRDGEAVAQCVARGEADIGMTLISEILPVPGAVVIAALPPGLGHDTTYAAAVSAASQSTDAAAALIGFVRRNEARPRWRAAGFILP
jgi:molybdate transport system substrate-binding protein